MYGFVWSPSSRGRGLKSLQIKPKLTALQVALFTRAWIEITCQIRQRVNILVALFTRAWIEMGSFYALGAFTSVALFTRAWIEMALPLAKPLLLFVALFTRAWIEIQNQHIKYTKGR